MQTLKLEDRPVPAQTSEVWDNHPHAIALRDGDRQLSYEELDRRADQFAGYLAQLGVVAGGTVAICMERSFDWIVAALGIMRAGAAYVPLDSAWPDSRLRFAVDDSGAAVLVARATLLSRLQVKARGVDPCRDAQAIAGAPAMLPRLIDPESLAYVIYTSGSTGVPKGVEITHANLSHLIQWHRNAFAVTRQDHVSHLLGLGFDAAVLEIWPHLCAGATLCLADDAVRSSPELMQQWMVRERVTIGVVPAVLGARLIAMEWPATTALRLLIIGGDALHHGPAAHLPFEVVNNYGPTECTVVSTWTVLQPGAEGTPPIGLPITGASVYLLNDNGDQVADGEIGEIYIGGSGVGRGYRNLPDVTERSFLPDPFVAAPGARIYRTGDRGMCRPDGNIEFRGRLDRQTKIRGHRVELDEISNLLHSHPSVDFATAITNVSEAGENQLVAYVLPKANVGMPSAHELQTYLLRNLPDYMIPAIFVRLHAMPLSPNGKIDLSMLPRPTAANLLRKAAANAPASPIAEKLLLLVRELLENAEVSAEDNFFLVGGHSLLGMQLLMQLQNRFGVDMKLQQLFEAPSVELLAVSVENILMHRPVESTAALPPGVLALGNPSARHRIFWIHYMSAKLAQRIGDDQSFFSVGLAAEDFLSLGESPTLGSIATCLLEKILAAQPEGPYTIGGLCIAGVLAYEIASQLQAAGREVSLLVLLDPPNPSYLDSCDSLTRKVSYLGYLVKRAGRLGPRLSFLYFREHLLRRLPSPIRSNPVRTERRIAQEMIETAAFEYQPKQYQGKVLLLLASERPPHVNFLPGWQAVIPDQLHTQYVQGHHRELIAGPYVESIADAIVYHLNSPFGEGSPQTSEEMAKAN
jgi:amino acid adenylation domain-containing protein